MRNIEILVNALVKLEVNNKTDTTFYKSLYELYEAECGELLTTEEDTGIVPCEKCGCDEYLCGAHGDNGCCSEGEQDPILHDSEK